MGDVFVVELRSVEGQLLQQTTESVRLLTPQVPWNTADKVVLHKYGAHCCWLCAFQGPGLQRLSVAAAGAAQTLQQAPTVRQPMLETTAGDGI
jgi:hypothetical protein